MQIFDVLFVHPILNLLVAFYKIFLQIGLPGALGFAVISLTVLVRFLVHPFFRKQMEASRKMAELKPQLDAISKEHKKDAQKLQQEQMKLYKEAGINPAAGCLYALIQIPLFIGLYNTLNKFLGHGTGSQTVNSINDALYFPFLRIQSLDPNFFVYNLAMTPAKSGEWYYYLIPVITGILQYFQAVTTPMPVMPKNKDGKKDDSFSGDFQRALNTQMKYFFPFMIAYFSYTLPVGLSLYWNIFSLFSIMQQRSMNPATVAVETVEEIVEEVEEEVQSNKKLKAKSKANKKKKK